MPKEKKNPTKREVESLEPLLNELKEDVSDMRVFYTRGNLDQVHQSKLVLLVKTRRLLKFLKSL